MKFVEDFGGRGPKYPFAVDAHRGDRSGLRRAVTAAAALILAVIGAVPALANHTVSGTISLPCINPALRKYGVDACGWRFILPTHGTGYRVHPAQPADLDIHFYDASDTFITGNTGPGPFGTECGDLIGDVPAGSVRAIVVLTPSVCGGVNGQSAVPATYVSVS